MIGVAAVTHRLFTVDLPRPALAVWTHERAGVRNGFEVFHGVSLPRMGLHLVKETRGWLWLDQPAKAAVPTR